MVAELIIFLISISAFSVYGFPFPATEGKENDFVNKYLSRKLRFEKADRMSIHVGRSSVLSAFNRAVLPRVSRDLNAWV